MPCNHCTSPRTAFFKSCFPDLQSESKKGAVGPSFHLHVEFDDKTPAIWDQNGKRYLREILPRVKRDEVQANPDEFFAGNGGSSYEFGQPKVDPPEFLFRYASGGTLVLVEFEGDQRPNLYYCLFYRDIHPIGWNIANGGTDTRAELLNPHDTIHRELREELIICRFCKKRALRFSTGRKQTT